MDVEQTFSFLVEEYQMSCKNNEYRNCYGGNWIVQTYSFYNDTGCMTIYFLPQRNELDFYRSAKYSNKLNDLCETIIDIHMIEPSIWEKDAKIFGIKNPFFEWSSKKVLCTFAKALKAHLDKKKDFFGISV